MLGWLMTDFQMHPLYAMTSNRLVWVQKVSCTVCLAILSFPIQAYAEEACVKVPVDWNAEVSAKSGVLCADVLVKTDEEGTRKLRVFESGKLAFESDDAALCKTCGGMKGDPFQGLQWSGTTLAVDNWGGSRETWAETWKFSKRRLNWLVIGWDRTITDSLTGSVWTESVNAVTHRATAEYQPGEEATCEEVSDKTTECMNGKPKAKKYSCSARIHARNIEISQLKQLREHPFSCSLTTP
jgi:hypothetical protein